MKPIAEEEIKDEREATGPEIERKPPGGALTGLWYAFLLYLLIAIAMGVTWIIFHIL